MSEHKKVMISSTVRDLPEHRKMVMHACMRMGMFHPEMMEHLTATDATPVQTSLMMVDKSELYICILGFRYGYVPPKKRFSITEMEYNRAVKRGIPRLVFLMSDEHPVTIKEVETGLGAKKLEKFKERLKNDLVVSFFKSPDELLAQVIQALVPYRASNISTSHYLRALLTS